MEHIISWVSNQALIPEYAVFVKRLWLGPGEPVRAHRLVAVNGRWTLIEPAHQPRSGDSVLNADLVCAGLVDLHVHVGQGVSPFALSPETVARSGVRTVCSQGDAGCRNFAGWHDSVDTGNVRSVIALNVAPMGEHGGGSGLEDVDARTPGEVVALARDYPDTIRMIGVNLSRRALGRARPEAILEVALLCRDETGLPLLIGLGEEAVHPIAEQLDRLIAGDVVTYCFRSRPWCLFPPDGTLEALERAVARGVLLDVGHGAASFDSEVARRALERGIVPHTISSDLQMLTASDGLFVGIVDVINKLLDCGLTIDDALAGVTRNPSQVLGLTDGTGVIRAGGRAELSVIQIRDSHLQVTPLAL